MVLGRPPFIYHVVPKSIRSHIPKQLRDLTLERYNWARDSLIDQVEYLFANRKGEFVPPRHLIRLSGIGGNVTMFRFSAREQLKSCIELGGLSRDGKLLEIGCGLGKLAGSLTKYLNDRGRYEGLDVHDARVSWCRRTITPRFPNFRFHLIDVLNKGYNPGGSVKQSEFEFPYNDESFDLVFSYSVYTHMVLQDTAHYLHETSRVLKNNGVSINSFLLLNAESRQLIANGQSRYADLKYSHGLSRFAQKNLPESTIAHDEDEVRNIYRKSGLRIHEPIRYGSWSGREKFVDRQDIIIAGREI